MAPKHTHCTVCGVLLRQANAPITPDTKVHAGRGVCTTDRKRAEREGTWASSPQKSSLSSLFRQREQFEADRRARGIPVGGVGFIARRGDNR